jgi:SecD/SecF fusion protein
MQAKGIVKFFAIALTIVCIYQLSFTFKTYKVEKVAAEFGAQMAQHDLLKYADLEATNALRYDSLKTIFTKKHTQEYLDSISNEEVYNLLIKNFTYDEIKDNQLSLGLDLQGGMSVLMQVSVEDLLKNLAGNNKNDKNFKAALKAARDRETSSEANFIALFLDTYKEITNDGRLATIFATRQNQGLIEPDFDNAKISEILKTESADAIDRTYQILNARIDQFGVASPNISRLENSDKIFIELPGVANPSRVRKLLQAPAKLELWETYKFEEIYPQLAEADKIVKEIRDLDKEINEGDSTNAIDIPIEDQSLLIDADSSDDTLNMGVDSLEMANNDSLNQIDTNQFEDFNFESADSTDFNAEEFANQYPFLFLINASDNLRGGPRVGFVLPKDTGKVNDILKMEELKGIFPSELLLLWSAKANANGYYELYAIKKSPINDRAALEGDVITDASQSFDQNGRPNIEFQMNSEGARDWAKLTAANVEREVAIVLDRKVYSAPTVQGEIRGGRSEITGVFTISEAKDLANKLKSGKLPAPARIVQESIVGPTLGQESIQKGIISLVSGLILVLLFMIFYYNKAGIVSDMALVINIFFIFGLLASLGATLTLPGIAGIVLTIGMAVDANVIIYERIREELAKGKGMKLAIADGYTNSYSAIIDANVTTLITAGILFYFGLGPVKGFATVLIIGILSSLFTAVMISRVMIDWMLKKEMNLKFGNKLTLKAFKNTTYKFIGSRKIAYVISSIIILIGIGSFFTKGFELGVDFKGGRSYHVRFEQPVNAQEIKKVLTEKFNGATPIVKTVETSRELKITTAFMIDSTGTHVDSIVESAMLEGLMPYLKENTSLDEFNNTYLLESVTVKPTIADDIKNTSIVATIVALIGIFLYILLRFKKWQYSVGAIGALAHDVLVILGLFSIFNGILPFSMEIDQPFIAAILTVIGYSINDTVIVFDRVREFINERKKVAFKINVNEAINSTLSRTIITSGTTMFVMLTLFVYGGEAIRGFSFAILMGVIVGTYSSLYVATPIMVDLTKEEKEIKGKKPGRKA